MRRNLRTPVQTPATYLIQGHLSHSKCITVLTLIWVAIECNHSFSWLGQIQPPYLKCTDWSDWNIHLHSLVTASWKLLSESHLHIKWRSFLTECGVTRNVFLSVHIKVLSLNPSYLQQPHLPSAPPALAPSWRWWWWGWWRTGAGRSCWGSQREGSRQAWSPAGPASGGLSGLCAGAPPLPADWYIPGCSHHRPAEGDHLWAHGLSKGQNSLGRHCAELPSIVLLDRSIKSL